MECPPTYSTDPELAVGIAVSGTASPRSRMMTNEDLGLSSDAKEAAAFAILANEEVFDVCKNAPAATGASRPVAMGKLSI